MPRPPWKREVGLAPLLDRWLDSRVVRPCLAADELFPPQAGKSVPFPAGLGAGLAAALRGQGIEALYDHQARAFDAATSGKPVVIATPTASGKSLCFHLPVLQALADDPDARALYLYPTKALARDQEAAVRALIAASGTSTSAVVFDGDTPADARRAARERGGIVVTNPDMLHKGILPHHASWARTMQHLRYVVVDELHTYRGVFGSHVANVLRRLLRVARFHGSSPVLVGATATIGNAREHAARLFGCDPGDLCVLSESGAPRGQRRFFLFNPPVVNAELGIRASYVKQAVMLAGDLIAARVPTLVFGHSRNNVEVMLRYLRDRLAGDVEQDQVMGYRGGYLPKERREIERRLREGEILGVVATSALELGIDVGALDAVVCAGYPGSVAAMWQRFGRAGRRGELSACILVTSSAPLDQYLANDPAFLLGAPVEEARIDPDNVEILVQHLKCAAFELPFRRGDSFGTLGPTETVEALGFLEKHGVLHQSSDAFHWAAEAYPAQEVSLRSVGWDNVVILDVQSAADGGARGAGAPNVLAEIDWRGAQTMVHEQAIYQHDGACWQVERFDHENHKAYVRKVAADYYTDAMTRVQIALLEESATGSVVGGWPSGWGEVSLVEKVVGYKKIKFHTHENAGYGEVRLPEMQMHTTAFWLTMPEEVAVRVLTGRAAAVDALRGIGRALESVAALALMCDPHDLGFTLGDAEASTKSEPEASAALPRKIGGRPERGYSPTLFLYEHVPGGTGLAERIFEQKNALLARAHLLLARCACAGGCPACVGPVEATATTPTTTPASGRRASRKAVALELLGQLGLHSA